MRAFLAFAGLALWAFAEGVKDGFETRDVLLRLLPVFFKSGAESPGSVPLWPFSEAPW